jgi:hypothetical protein
VVPTNALFFVPLAVAAVALAIWYRASPREIALEICAWIGAVFLAVLLYLPVLSEVMAAGADQEPGSWASVMHTSRNVYSVLCRDAWPLALPALVGLAIGTRRALAGRARDPALPLVSLALLSVPLALTHFTVTGIYVRNFCPLIPFWGWLVGWLLAQLLQTIEGRRRWLSRPAVLAGGIAALAATLLPPVISYPARLAQRREKEMVQDGYYNYYAAKYRPSAAVDYVKRATRDGSDYLICFDPQADFFNLAYYLNRAGLAGQRLRGPTGRAASAMLYVVAPRLESFPAIAAAAANFGVTLDMLQEARLVEDFGYYRVYRSPEPVLIRRPPG